MSYEAIKIGIISREEYKRRTLAIARGEYRPGRGEPKIWFESLQSMTQVFSNENQDLLKIILEKEPGSIKELEAVTGKKRGRLSQSLKLMERFGIVSLEKRGRGVRPMVNATDFKIEIRNRYTFLTVRMASPLKRRFKLLGDGCLKGLATVSLKKPMRP